MILRFGRDRFDYVQIIAPSVNASLGVLESKPLFEIMIEVGRLSSYYFGINE